MFHPHHDLLRYFSGLAEQTFETELGVADPSLIDYIADLLARFSDSAAIIGPRNPLGRPLRGVTDMLIEAETRSGEGKLVAHRHIGDYTLFWTGVYPESLPRVQTRQAADAMFDFAELGKRSYHLASQLGASEESDVLERLSVQFELCQTGLQALRREWERQDDGPIIG